MTFFRYAVQILSLIALTAVLLPFIRLDHWVFRVFDYPRVQKLVYILILLAGWSVLVRQHITLQEKTIIALLGAAAIYLTWIIVPYSPLGKKMVPASGTNQPALKLLVYNVFQENDRYSELLELIKLRDPDVILLLETDQKWQKAVSSLSQAYPNTIQIPLDNTYGMLFFTRLPLSNQKINYFVEDTIPSITADIKFNGKDIKLFGLHPTPPVPQENSRSTERDAEILLVGKLAKKHKGPVLVMGDLNDVAWSYTTNLFLKTSGLLDPRRGRGRFSTFNARYVVLRWPLDHYFVSGHFRVADIRVEKGIGSDHFPISIDLTLEDYQGNQKLQETRDDSIEAREKIKAGLEN
jgi:endonuclease/exonuclease/phosphatase (EEP) superfamily protein YafD